MAKRKFQQTLRAYRQRLLLDAAERILAGKGCHGFSTEELAQTAGVGKGTVYAHCPSQSAWVEAVLADVGSRVQPLLLAASGTGSPDQQLVNAVSFIVTQIADCPKERLAAPCCLCRSPCPYNGWAMLQDLLRRWIEEGLKTGAVVAGTEPELAARVLHHLLSAVTSTEHKSRTARRKVLDWVQRGYLRGLLEIRE
jgi:AcrR family transcriptional regulator